MFTYDMPYLSTSQSPSGIWRLQPIGADEIRTWHLHMPSTCLLLFKPPLRPSQCQCPKSTHLDLPSYITKLDEEDIDVNFFFFGSQKSVYELNSPKQIHLVYYLKWKDKWRVPKSGSTTCNTCEKITIWNMMQKAHCATF